MLWLESNRMGFLLDAVSQGRNLKFKKARLGKERAQSYESKSLWLNVRTHGEAALPWRSLVLVAAIGYVEDLDRVDVNDLKNLLPTWYGPNNAVLTIGGDIDVDDTLKWVHKYFGPILKALKLRLLRNNLRCWLKISTSP